MSYFYTHARDPISSFTHCIGMCCAAFGCLLLVLRAKALQIELGILASAVVFAISLIALYAASTFYHFYKGCDRILLRLRKLDHAIIYVLIAGTYTPIAVHCMEYEAAIHFLRVIWIVAAAGIVVKLCWIMAPRWLYTSLYLLMGWAIIFDWPSFAAMESGCMYLVAAGGLCYSAGAVIYILKRPVITKNFGFHEIFHLFILVGSLLHYLAVFFYVLQ
ncbi:PAQR family membrane homeostasis protein TrhA [Oscillospiraceae bacterium LTW-04]|nr:hemolysin III family protein [Oscillospiraceae bacterium MB24-C1]